MATLTNLKISLRNRTRAMETLLGRITTPIQNLTQHMQCTNYIKSINKLDYEANNDLLTIEAEYKDDIDCTELAAFRTFMAKIESRTSAFRIRP